MRQEAGWHREDIKAAVRKRGKTLCQLSLESGLSISATRKTFFYAVPRADRAISAFIEVPLHELWPDRYDEQGNRIYASRRSKALSSGSTRKRKSKN